MTDQHSSALSKAEVAADWIIAEARTALTELGSPDRMEYNGRKVAVHHLAAGAARGSTARIAAALAETGFTDSDELHIAHLLIAELATRLAEQEAAG